LVAHGQCLDLHRGGACMPGLAVRRRWVLIPLAGVFVGGLVAVVIVVAKPYVEYPEATKRSAVAHLAKVTVDGFEYLGEDSSDVDAVSRFWIRQDAGLDLASAIEYDGLPTRRDHPGRDAPSRSEFEEEVGWLSFASENRICALTAYRVKRVDAGTGVDLSDEEKREIAAGLATLVRVVVACGEG
jgi:hypothetical protein